MLFYICIFLFVVIIVLQSLTYNNAINSSTQNKYDNKSRVDIHNKMDSLLDNMVSNLEIKKIEDLFSHTMSISGNEMPFSNYISYDNNIVNDSNIIVYINLSKNIERCERMEKMLQKYYPNQLVLRLEGIVDCYKGLGILKSHLRALQISKMFNNNVLILEDDFYFSKTPVETHNIIDELYESHSNFDVFMLAPFIFTWKRLENSNFMKIYKATTASAYIVHKNYLDKIIDHYQSTLKKLKYRDFIDSDYNDQTWCTLQFSDNWITYKELLGNQYAGITTGGDYADNTFEISIDQKSGISNTNKWPILLS